MAAFTFEYFAITISVLLLLAVFFYFLYRKFLSSKTEEVSSKLTGETEKDKKWYNIFNPFVSPKIKHLKHKREHKVKDKEHHDFFREFGEQAEKIDNAAFNKLKRVVKHHKGTEKVFKNLEEVAEVLKEKERKLTEKKEIKDSISKLKGMFGKK